MLTMFVMLLITTNFNQAHAKGDLITLSAIKGDNGDVELSVRFKEATLSYWGAKAFLVPKISVFSTKKNASPTHETENPGHDEVIVLNVSDDHQVFWASGNKRRIYLVCKNEADGGVLCQKTVSAKEMDDKKFGNFFVVGSYNDRTNTEKGAWLHDDKVKELGNFTGMINKKARDDDVHHPPKNLSDDEKEFFQGLRAAEPGTEIGYYIIDGNPASNSQALRGQDDFTPEEKNAVARKLANQDN